MHVNSVCGCVCMFVFQRAGFFQSIFLIEFFPLVFSLVSVGR